MRELGVLRGQSMGSDDRRRGGQNKKASSRPNGTRDPFLRVQNGPKTALHRDSWPDISIPLIRMQEPALAKYPDKGLPEAATVPLMDALHIRPIMAVVPVDILIRLDSASE